MTKDFEPATDIAPNSVNPNKNPANLTLAEQLELMSEIVERDEQRRNRLRAS